MEGGAGGLRVRDFREVEENKVAGGRVGRVHIRRRKGRVGGRGGPPPGGGEACGDETFDRIVDPSVVRPALRPRRSVSRWPRYSTILPSSALPGRASRGASAPAAREPVRGKQETDSPPARGVGSWKRHLLRQSPKRKQRNERKI